jgi:hypothetical protein
MRLGNSIFVLASMRAALSRLAGEVAQAQHGIADRL